MLAETEQGVQRGLSDGEQHRDAGQRAFASGEGRGDHDRPEESRAQRPQRNTGAGGEGVPRRGPARRRPRRTPRPAGSGDRFRSAPLADGGSHGGLIIALAPPRRTAGPQDAVRPEERRKITLWCEPPHIHRSAACTHPPYGRSQRGHRAYARPRGQYVTVCEPRPGGWSMSIWWSLHLRREAASVPLARRLLIGTMETSGRRPRHLLRPLRRAERGLRETPWSTVGTTHPTAPRRRTASRPISTANCAASRSPTRARDSPRPLRAARRQRPARRPTTPRTAAARVSSGNSPTTSTSAARRAGPGPW